LLLTLLSVVVMFLLGDISHISSHLSTYRWNYFVIAVILFFLTHMLKFAKFNLFLSNAGVRFPSFEKRIDLYLACSPLNATSNRVNDGYHALSISRATGIPLTQADGITLVNRFADIPAMVILAAIGIVCYPPFYPFFIGLLFIILIANFNLKLFPYLPPTPILGSKRNRFRTAWQNLLSMNKVQPGAHSAVITILAFLFQSLAWLAQAGSLYFVLQGFGYLPTLALAGTSLLVIAFTMFAGLLSNLPGGVGVIEMSMAALLTVLLDFQPDLAILATLLYRAATFWIGFLFGILAWPDATRAISQKPGAVRIDNS
jgi:hypothetical protein